MRNYDIVKGWGRHVNSYDENSNLEVFILVDPLSIALTCVDMQFDMYAQFM